MFKGILLLVGDHELLMTMRSLSWESAVQCVSRAQIQVCTYIAPWKTAHLILATRAGG